MSLSALSVPRAGNLTSESKPPLVAVSPQFGHAFQNYSVSFIFNSFRECQTFDRHQPGPLKVFSSANSFLISISRSHRSPNKAASWHDWINCQRAAAALAPPLTPYRNCWPTPANPSSPPPFAATSPKTGGNAPVCRNGKRKQFKIFVLSHFTAPDSHSRIIVRTEYQRSEQPTSQIPATLNWTERHESRCPRRSVESFSFKQGICWSRAQAASAKWPFFVVVPMLCQVLT